MNAGKYPHLTLTHSGIYIQLPLVQLTNPESFGPLSRGIVPDQPLEDRPDTRRDEVMACAQALARGKPCSSPGRPDWLSRK